MQIENLLRKAIYFLLLLTLTAPISGQIKNDKKLSPISPQLRDRFVERLNLYFNLLRTKQYPKLYDLLSEYAYNQNKRFRREDDIKYFEELNAKGEMDVPLKWKLYGVTRQVDDYGREFYLVELDLKYQYGMSKGNQVVVLDVLLQNRDWYIVFFYLKRNRE